MVTLWPSLFCPLARSKSMISVPPRSSVWFTCKIRKRGLRQSYRSMDCLRPRLRILHVNHTLDLGGTEIMLLDLANGQKRLGHNVTICSMYGPGLLDEKAREYGLTVVHLNSPNKLTSKVKLLTAYLDKHPQDMVHSHWGVWIPTAISGFLKRTR